MASDKSRRSEAETIELDEIIQAGIERGLTMSDVRRMQIGQLVDFCITYNERQKRAEQQENGNKPKKVKATQAQIDAYFG